MKSQLMVDLECLATLDDHANAIVLNLAAVAFEMGEPLTEDNTESLFIKFDVSEQRKLGRMASRRTIEWWSKQPKETQDLVKPKPYDVSLAEGKNTFQQWLEDNVKFGSAKFRFWQRGSIDETLLRNLFREVDYELPFSFGAVRDVRTAVELFNLMNWEEQNKYGLPSDDAIKEFTDEKFSSWWEYSKSKEFSELPYIQSLPKHDPRADCYSQILQLQISAGIL